MTNRETVHRNLSLTFDFVKQLIEKPELIKNIADNAELEFLEKNLSAGENTNTKSNGRRKSFVKVRNSFELTKS